MATELTSASARAILDRVAKEKPEKLLAASNSLLFAALDQAAALREELQSHREATRNTFLKVGASFKKLAEEVVALKGGGAEAPADAPAAPATAAPAAAAAAAPAAARAPGRVARKRADGQDMTPEEEALEDQMDAATAGMPPHPGAGGGGGGTSPDPRFGDVPEAPPIPVRAVPKSATGK